MLVWLLLVLVLLVREQLLPEGMATQVFLYLDLDFDRLKKQGRRRRCEIGGERRGDGGREGLRQELRQPREDVAIWGWGWG